MKKNIAFIMLVLLLSSCTQNQKTNEEKPEFDFTPSKILKSKTANEKELDSLKFFSFF